MYTDEIVKFWRSVSTITLRSKSISRLAIFSVIVLTIGCFICGHVIAQTHVPDFLIHTDDIQDIQFSADGDHLLVVGCAKVQRYDLSLRRFDMQLSFPITCSTKYAISADGTRLARVDDEASEVQIIDFSSGDTVLVLPYPSTDVSPLLEIEFARSDTLVAVQQYGQLYISDISDDKGTDETWNEIELDATEIFSLDESGVLVTTSEYGDRVDVRASYVSEPQLSRVFNDGVSFLSNNRDGVLLMQSRINDSDEYENVWHILDLEDLSPLGEPWAVPSSELVFRDGGLHGDRALALYSMASGSVISGIVVFDVAEQSVLFSEPEIHPFSVLLSSDGRWLAVERQGVIEVYGMEEASLDSLGKASGEPQTTPQPRLVVQAAHSGLIEGLAVSHDGNIVAIAGADGWVSLWDRTSARVFHRFSPGYTPRSVAFSHDGSQLLVAGDDSSVTATVWDVASGELRQQLDHVYFGSGDSFAAFLSEGSQLLMCNKRNNCTRQELSLEVRSSGTRSSLADGSSDYYYFAVSLAPDEASVALALGDEGVGWMELSTNGRQQIVSIAGDVEVTAVAALGGAELAACLSNGNVLLINAVRGEIVRTIHTRETRCGALVRLDDTRLAVALYGEPYSPDDPPGEILIVSSKELTVLNRLRWTLPMGVGDRPSSAYIDLLAASADGRWLVSSSQPAGSDQPLVQLWDTATGRIGAQLGSRVLPTERLELAQSGNNVLADSGSVASLWNLHQGSIMKQFGNRETRSDTHGTLTEDTVVYVPPYSLRDWSIRLWSLRSGSRDVLVPKSVIDYWDHPFLLSVDGTRVGVVVDGAVLLLSLHENGKHAQRVTRDEIGLFSRISLYESADLLLLDLRENGIEALTASDAETIWVRDDIIIDRYEKVLLLTEDHSGVVVVAEAEDRYGGDYDLLVLDADTGETRFRIASKASPLEVEKSVPVVHNNTVTGDTAFDTVAQ